LLSSDITHPPLRGFLCSGVGFYGIGAHYHIRKSCKECKRRRAELAAANTALRERERERFIRNNLEEG